MAKKLRIAWFSPLPLPGEPPRTAAEHATSLLAPILARQFDIEFFHDRFDRFGEFETRHFLSCFTRHAEKPFDVFFYQVEDGKRAYFTREHLALAPGVVWFHNLVLSDFGPEPLLNSPWTEVVKRFAGRTGGWPERGAEFHRASPLALREAAYAAVALFSSMHDHDEYLRNANDKLGDARSAHLPLPVEPLVPEAPLRSRKILFCGEPGIEDRCHKLFPALVDLGTRAELVWLVGDDERALAEARLAEFGLVGAEIVLGRSPERWQELVQCGAAAAHPRFSAYGRTAPYLNISMMAGLPCVVSDFWGHRHLPEGSVVKVAPGGQESIGYREALRTVLGPDGRALGASAREYAGEFFDKRAVAAELSAVFVQEAETLGRIGAEWRRLEREAKSALLEETHGLAAPGSGILDAWTEELTSGAFAELGWEAGK